MARTTLLIPVLASLVGVSVRLIALQHSLDQPGTKDITNVRGKLAGQSPWSVDSGLTVLSWRELRNRPTPIQWQPQPPQQVLPVIPSMPSFAIIGTITSPATGSAHHQPNSAFRSKPPNRIADR